MSGAIFMSAEISVDLHGYYPTDITGDPYGLAVGTPLSRIIEQAWEMGAGSVRFIHGHGRGRGQSPGFVNTNTGYFGLKIRSALRYDIGLRQWIKYTTLDCSDNGSTVVKLKANPHPTRTKLDDVFPEKRF
jgi:hypothetical protein